MSGVNAGVNLALTGQDVSDTLKNINISTMPQDEAISAIVEHMRCVFPKHNVMVVHPQHLQHFQECAHTHIEIKPFVYGTVGYEVYVFKRGHFTLLGDGGSINWCFNGNFNRDGKAVTFYDL